jgi:hypothetical protein
VPYGASCLSNTLQFVGASRIFLGRGGLTLKLCILFDVKKTMSNSLSQYLDRLEEKIKTGKEKIYKVFIVFFSIFQCTSHK